MILKISKIKSLSSKKKTLSHSHVRHHFKPTKIPIKHVFIKIECERWETKTNKKEMDGQRISTSTVK